MLESKLLLFCAIVLMIRPNSGQLQEKYVGKLTCENTADEVGCKEGVLCTGICDASCAEAGNDHTIWGAGIYTFDSVICRAAAHDYRMTTWTAPVNVTFQRNLTDTKKYHDSIQQYIGSDWFADLPDEGFGHYVFTSPYVSEAIVDVATINSNYLSDPANGIDFVQKCAIDGTSADITFSYYTPDSTKLTGTPSSADNSALVQQMTWTDPDLESGGFFCNLKNNVYSNVMSISMRANAYFIPEKLTITANVGDNVVLKFIGQQVPDPKDGVEWVKNDGSPFPDFNNFRRNRNGNEYTLTINGVQFGDGAVYSLQLKKSELRRGVVRLIVPRCPAGKYGTKCDQACPTCANGGICHDVMGTCICAPGFNGDLCQNACPGGLFGEQCTKGCGGSCKGVLVCLPDPYGCSCAPGYTGLACDVEVTTETKSTNQPIATTSQPTVTTNQPIVTTSQPIVTTNQPIVTTNQPIVTTNQPIITTNQQTVTTSQPIVTTNQPIVTTNQAIVTTNQPIVTTNQPIATTNQPIVTTNQPIVTTNQPIVTTNQPIITTNQPTVTTSQPTVTTSQPTVTTSQPTVTTSQPTITTSQPIVTTSQPIVTTSQPIVTTNEPSVTTNEPIVTTNQPIVTTNPPIITTNQPTVTTSQPIVTTNQPIVTTNQPIVTTSQPIVTTNQPIVTTNQPIITTNQPIITTNQPTVTTSQPIVTTNQPIVTTNQPIVTTNQQTVTTNQPTVTTSQPIVTTNQPIVTTNQPIVTTSQPTVTTSQPIVTTSQPIVTTNQPIWTTYQPIWTTYQPIRTTQRGGYIVDDKHFLIYYDSLDYVCPKTSFHRIRRLPCKRLSQNSRRAQRQFFNRERKCQEYLQKYCQLLNSF